MNRQAKRRSWRQWTDLSEREQHKIRRRIRRQRTDVWSKQGVWPWVERLRLKNSAAELVALRVTPTYPYPSNRRVFFLGRNSRYSTKSDEYRLHSNTPHERINQKRLERLAHKLNIYRERLDVEFLPNLHPNDVEWIAASSINGPAFVLTADRQAGHPDKIQSLHHRPVLGASLWAQYDQPDIAIWLVAYVAKDMTLRRGYVGSFTVEKPAQNWELSQAITIATTNLAGLIGKTNAFKHPEGAYKSALKMYNAMMAARIAGG